MMPPRVDITSIETRLNDFSLDVRTSALTELIKSIEAGQLQVQTPTEIANMHCHTFFSYNAYGYSPTGLAWMAKQRGFKLLGIVDFDVLDGVDEFLQACEAVGVRGAANLETRVHLPEFATREINSPGEPGIYYTMGIGFTSSSVPAEVAPILSAMRLRAEQRNRIMLERLNSHLYPVIIDYDNDVLSLTPSGNATERHMLMAYIKSANDHFHNPNHFWAEKLGLLEEQVNNQSADLPKFQNLIRSKLMKHGGVGYVKPSPENFPTIEEVNRLIVACGALPCAAWLDGLSAGEQAIEELLQLLIVKGAVAINIIPDRNWDISDPETRRIKLQKLYEVIDLARKLDLPVNFGTEMNAPGQKFVDDFDAPEITKIRSTLLDGAYFIYGHTILQRSIGLGYQSQWAKAHFTKRQKRNAFYARAGRILSPGAGTVESLKKLGPNPLPADILSSR